MPQQNMQELAHALFQYIKEVCQLTQKEIFDVDKQRAWVLLSQLDDPACVKLYSRDTVDDETVNNDGKLFSFRKPEFAACPAPECVAPPLAAAGLGELSETARVQGIYITAAGRSN